MTVEVTIITDAEAFHPNIILIDKKIYYEGNFADDINDLPKFLENLIYVINEKAEVTTITIPR